MSVAHSKKLGPNDSCPICGKKSKHCTGHKKSKFRMILSGILVVLMFAVGISMTTSRQDTKLPTQSTGSQQTKEPKAQAVPPAAYSKEDPQKFFDEYAGPLITKLMRTQWRIPSVNQRLVEIIGKIKQRYQQPINIVAVQDYHPIGKMIPFNATVQPGNQPTVTVIIPALIDAYDVLRLTGHPKWDQAFENAFVIVFMHELDHLAYGRISKWDDSEEEMIEVERETWAITCEEDIRLFFEHGEMLALGMAEHYQVWLQCGKNPDSPIWRNHFINYYNRH